MWYERSAIEQSGTVDKCAELHHASAIGPRHANLQKRGQIMMRTRIRTIFGKHTHTPRRVKRTTTFGAHE